MTKTFTPEPEGSRASKITRTLAPGEDASASIARVMYSAEVCRVPATICEPGCRTDEAFCVARSFALIEMSPVTGDARRMFWPSLALITVLSGMVSWISLSAPVAGLSAMDSTIRSVALVTVTLPRFTSLVAWV
ncbi:hypothetical protein D3C81_1648270 [compost metagenome]